MLKKIFRDKSTIGWKNKILHFISVSKKPIFFIHTDSISESFVSLLKDISLYIHSNALFICINSKVPYYYNDITLHFKAIDDYMSIDDYDSIDSFVSGFIKRWYLPESTDATGITEYNGMHLGSIVEYDFRLFLIRRLKWLHGIYNIINDERPDRIIILEDTGELVDLAKLIEDTFNIPLLALHRKIAPKDTYSLKRNLKSFISDIISGLIDSFVKIIFIFKIKDAILIDIRAYVDLSANMKLPKNFIPIPFEKGLNLRTNLLKRRFIYLPFYFPSNFHMKRRYFSISNVIDLKKISSYNGLYCIDKLIEQKINEYFSISFPLIIKNIKLLEKFLSRRLIKAIILGHDLWELQRTCVEVARKYGVSTIVVQQGIFGERGQEIIFADKIAVWGKMCADIYKSFGNAHSKCHITGNPRLDVFFNSKLKFSREQICGTLGLDKNKKIIILASGFYKIFASSYMTGDENNVIISELVKIMKELPQYQLIIKLHPYENFEFSNKVIKYYNLKNVVAIKNFDLFSLINASDLVLTKRSSIGLKAMVLDKPVIVINFEKRREINPYVRAKVVLEVDKPTDISAAIIAALENSQAIDEFKAKSRMFIQDYAYKIDGQSSKRVLDFIERVTVNNRKEVNY